MSQVAHQASTYSRCESLRLCYLPFNEGRKEIRLVHSTDILSITVMTRKVNSIEIASFLLNTVQRATHRITHHYSAQLQTAKQTLTTSENSIEVTYSKFPCHVKVNRDKLALISCLWKCKEGERLTDSARCGGPDEKIPPASGNNKFAGFLQFRPLTS